MAIKFTNNTGEVVEFGRRTLPPRTQEVVATNGGPAAPEFPALLGALTPVGWQPPLRAMTLGQLKLEQRGIAIRHRAAIFALGDLVNYGQAKHGEKYAQIIDDTGYDYSYLCQVASVARSIPMEDRVAGLPYGHHRAVASIKDGETRKALLLVAGEMAIPRLEFEEIVDDLKAQILPRGKNWGPDEARSLLDELPPEEIARYARELRQVQIAKRKSERLAEIAAKRRALPDLPDQTYEILYADPPWRFEKPAMGTTNRSAEDKYPTMTRAELCNLPVSELVGDEGMLFMWARPGMLDVALDVMKAWGFDYKGELVWAKDKIGMGYYFRNQHEIMLFGNRGEYPIPAEKVRRSSLLTAKRRAHSQKPDELYKIIDSYYPEATKIELFQRDGAQSPRLNGRHGATWRRSSPKKSRPRR